MADNDIFYLWLLPENEAGLPFTRLIESLSERFNTPVFAPHVTLLGKLSGYEKDLVSRAGWLAGQLSPFSIQLTDVEYLDEYYRCLFLRVGLDDALVSARHLAMRVFDVQQEPDAYLPHLSILYADLPVSTKHAIKAEVGSDYRKQFTVDRLQLIRGGLRPEDWHVLCTEVMDPQGNAAPR